MADGGGGAPAEGRAAEGRSHGVVKTRDQKQLLEEKKNLEYDFKKVQDQLRQARASSEERAQELQECEHRKEELEQEVRSIRDGQSAALGADEKAKVVEIAEGCIRKYISTRDGRERTMTVDVHYFSGGDKTGAGLLGGSEGAGSRLLQTEVQLDWKVKKLANRAAKHWGLDERKVFFLDRDGRILPDEIQLSEVILPPRQRSASSASRRPEAPGAADALPALQGPPAERLALEGGAGSAGPPPGGAAAGALAPAGLRELRPPAGGGLPGLPQEAGGEVSEVCAVEGRNYKLTLVPAEAALQREDLTKPKGEKYDDFTFDLSALEHDLEQTRKKQGVGKTVEAVKMEDIPSLADLINKGKNKKMKQRQDKLCRRLEFFLFVIQTIVFYLTISPDSRQTILNRYVIEGSTTVLERFVPAERSTVGAAAFMNVTQHIEYSAWLKGPLRRGLYENTLRDLNVHPLAASAWAFKPEESDLSDLSFCPEAPAASTCNLSEAAPEPPTNDSSQQCYDGGLRRCKNRRVVQVFSDAARDCHSVPACRPQSKKSDLRSIGYSAVLPRWSMIDGKVNSYSDGIATRFNLSDPSDFDNAIPSMEDWRYGDVVLVAQMILVFVYSPTTNSVYAFQLLAEETLSGSIVTSRVSSVVSFVPDDAWMYFFHIMVFLTSCTTLLLELRRVFAWPRFTFVVTSLDDDDPELRGLTPEKRDEKKAEHMKKEIDEQREHGSVCTLIVFLLLPLVQLAVFIMFCLRNSVDADDMVTVSDKQISADVEDELFRRYRLQYFEEGLQLLLLFAVNALYWRYLLMFFPELQSTSNMAAQLARPLGYALLALLLVFLALSSFTFAVYSTKFFGWHAPIPTLLRAVAIAQGDSPGYDLYKLSPAAFTILILGVFVVVTMIMNNIALAIMVSYSKERDLRKNYQYHKQWQQHSWQSKKQAGADGQGSSFNPATAGLQFWVELDDKKRERSRFKKKDVST